MRILRNLEYVEQSGFGINKMIDAYVKGVFKITDNFKTVVLTYNKDVIKKVKFAIMWHSNNIRRR